MFAVFAIHSIALYFSLSVILQVLVLCAGHVLASCLSALKQGFKSPQLTHRWQSGQTVWLTASLANTVYNTV